MIRTILLSLLLLISCSKETYKSELIRYTLTVTASPSNGGLVNPTKGSYNPGEQVTILASANQYYIFNKWTGNWNSTENQVTITMDSNKTLTANFTKVDDDEDGVLNTADTCPGTPQGFSVDSNGCGLSQLDSDGDGVTDDIDQCENTSVNSAFVSSTGCKIDIFYFADNGVTIKAIEQAQVGMQEEFNGNTFTVVSREQLDQMIDNEEDLSFVVTSKITDMSGLFYEEEVNGDISSWDVSNVTFMNGMFSHAINFNQPIGNWDVSNVINMYGMFLYADSFNQPIGNWDVSNVENMVWLLSNTNFNQPIGDWDVSSVIDMSGMFQTNPSFNQPIGNWDVSNVTNMDRMFLRASSFNQPIGDWDVSSVNHMDSMFTTAVNFNQPIGDWDVSNVTRMGDMFRNASSFNQPLGDWDVSSVTDMGSMFTSYANGYNEVSFNQPIGDWDVSNVTDMRMMFGGNDKFNQDISNWNVSNVITMANMFQLSNFNQPIGNWDVSSVTDMSNMFYYTASFNQDLSNWNVSNVLECNNFSGGTDVYNLPKPNFTLCNTGTSISNPDSSNGTTSNSESTDASSSSTTETTESTDSSSTSGSSGTTETTESTDSSSTSTTEITYSIPSNFQLSSTHLAAETFYSILLQWDYNDDQNINSINIYRGDSASQLSLHKNITNSSSSQYQDTEVDIRKDYYYQISYVYSNQEYSRTEILNTQAYEPVNSNNPPSNEVGGVHYANQYFSVDRFDSIKHKFTIHSEPSNNTPLYYQFYQGQINDNIGFYYGIQTLMSSTNNPNPRGKALIFSRWETNDSSNLSLADGGWSEVAGYEGDFISVRNAYEWTSGTYEIELKKDSTDVVGDWYSLKIKSFPNGNEVHAGSIRFESSSSASGIKSGGILWTEIYGNGSYPDWHVSVDDITINDNQKPNYIGTAYSSKFKDFSNIYTTNNCDIHFLMGPNVKNITPAYTFDWCE